MNSNYFCGQKYSQPCGEETGILIILKNVNWKYTNVPNCNKPKEFWNCLKTTEVALNFVSIKYFLLYPIME